MNITPKNIESAIKTFRNDIISFVNICIIEPFNESGGHNYFITNQQREALLAVQKLALEKEMGLSKKIFGISIMSGKGTGKDAFTSWCILWFMFCFPWPKVPCVSVSADQLSKVLWSEIGKWLTSSKIKDYFVLQNDKLYFKEVPENIRGKRWFAFPKAANPKKSLDEQVETLQGIHEDYMMQVVDEGSGVLDSVYSALENNMTSLCNFMLIIFNPMHTKGYAVRTQYEDKENWITFQWSSEDSEITNKEKLRAMERKYGRDSNTFRMNVLGLPPIFDQETLINWDWVMAAIDRPIEVLPGTPMVWGIDCGAGGDKSIIAARRGGILYPFRRFSTSDSVELTNWIGHEIDKDSPDCVRVDTIGIGWAVEGALREKKGAIIEAADVRRKADDPQRFLNKRMEMAWNFRERFERGAISIPNDPDFLEQLGSIKYKINGSGQMQLQEKKEIKKETGHSPDEFDASCITDFYNDDFLSLANEFEYGNYETKGTSWQAA
jgi:phage terminase large subunit